MSDGDAARVVIKKTSDGRLWFFCQGCEDYHCFRVDHPAGGNWQWNGDYARPTVTPSIKVTQPWGDPPVDRVCHSFMTDGQIQYLADCTHALAGQTVPLRSLNGVYS